MHIKQLQHYYVNSTSDYRNLIRSPFLIKKMIMFCCYINNNSLDNVTLFSLNITMHLDG